MSVEQDLSIGPIIDRRLAAALRPFLGQELTPEVILKANAKMATVLAEAQRELGFPMDYLYGAVTAEPNGLGGKELQFSVARDYSKYRASFIEMVDLLGRDPTIQEFHQINCDKAGHEGHEKCGFCLRHGKPNFLCGCRAVPLMRPSAPPKQLGEE